MKHKCSFVILISIFLLVPLAQANVKIGIVIADHCGPEYYPAAPDGNQCVACDQGQPYTDGYNHSADGYFSLKYFLADLVNKNGAIPGFVVDDFEYHGFGIVLMDKNQPSEIVSGTPDLIDAWGKEGIYVNPAIPGADPVTGYITYTKLYTDFLDIDGTHLYVWPIPYPYPTGNPAYPANKDVSNNGGVPFYLLPRDAMNAYQDATFMPGWSIPGGALYLEGPIVESGNHYPDNNWQNMLGWEYYTAASDFFGTIQILNNVSAWNEHDFWEFVGFDAYTGWLFKGGREVYAEEVTGQMNQIKDWLWANYGSILTGGASGNKDDYIRNTYLIDPCFCNNVTPTDSIHAKSMYDAVYDLITRVAVDKIIMHDHYIVTSPMTSDDGAWRITLEAIEKANLDSGRSFSIENDLIFAPGHPYSGDLMASPFSDYYTRYYLGSKPVPELVSCGGFSGPTWSSPPYPNKAMWIAGTALRPEYTAEVVTKAVAEFNWAVGKGAADIAMFLPFHGGSTTTSWCYDTVNDYMHYTTKLAFVRATEAIFNSSSFTATMGSVVSKAYEPYALSTAELLDLADQTDGDDLAILDRDIQACKVLLSTGRRIVFYRTYGENAYFAKDPSKLVYSPREALNNIMDVLNPTTEWNVTHIVDIPFGFMGSAGDILVTLREEGYGEDLYRCADTRYNAQFCAEETYLAEKSIVYPNPIIDDPSNPNAWSNFLSNPDQFCYPPEGYLSNPCWDYGHDNPSCSNNVPEGCYVSLFTIYDNASAPKYDPVNTPNGLKVKIANGSWGWDGKVAASRNTISEVIEGYLYSTTTTTPTTTTVASTTTTTPTTTSTAASTTTTSALPTVIVLASFEANTGPRSRDITVKWATASEIDTAGFNLYRSTSADGTYTKVNNSLIPSKGSATSGATYSVVDSGLKKRSTYYYKLEEVNNTGNTTQYGPVSATTRGRFRFLSR